MATITLKPEIERLYLDQLADLIADALCQAETDDTEGVGYEFTRTKVDKEVRQAARDGRLPIRDPMTLDLWDVPAPAVDIVDRVFEPSRVNLRYAVVLLQDIGPYLASRGLVMAAPEQTVATPAPVVAASDATPDPERRLALLRALGGTAKYKNCEWTFTGIGALVAQEQADGRKRSTEKTIRADLKEAAQNERDANRAGFGAGLGQR